ncbi:putative RING-H2 finger protein ATL69 [Rhodamnia argentea]|uniref:RING-type E3 ubiquitin transferase n=1 Tax=Rhodamnia argentea TaxID=178133 RepID=A0A8B8MX97_9MYRT|nr:putative RING-H2 finger protein ATL69 [Rhodamnia argentea]
MASVLKLKAIATTALDKATFVATVIVSLVRLCAKAFRWSQYPPALTLSQRHQAPPYCAVCLHDVAAGERYRRLWGCGHCFHAECIDAWLGRHATCPLCRSHVAGVGPPRREGRDGRSSGLILVILSFSQSIFGKGVVVPGENSRSAQFAPEISFASANYVTGERR